MNKTTFWTLLGLTLLSYVSGLNTLQNKTRLQKPMFQPTNEAFQKKLKDLGDSFTNKLNQLWRLAYNANLDSPEIRIIQANQLVPPKWRIMTFQEGQVYKNVLTSITSEWAIVGLNHGKFYGAGYGSKLVNETSLNSEQFYIIKFPLRSGVRPQPKVVKPNIKIIGLNQTIPKGWRIMTYEEGKKYEDLIKPLMSQWAVVGFDHGKYDGEGYGNKFMDRAGLECGQIFIIQYPNSVLNQIQKPKRKASRISSSTEKSTKDDRQKERSQLEVKIIAKKDPIPDGWRVMTYEEGQEFANQLRPMVPFWGVVGFDHGKLDGQGFGSKFMPEAGAECGEIFIIKE